MRSFIAQAMKLCEAKAGGKSIREIPKGLPIGKSKAVRGIIDACAFHSPLFLYKDHVLNFCFQICNLFIMYYIFINFLLKAANRHDKFYFFFVKMQSYRQRGCCGCQNLGVLLTLFRPEMDDYVHHFTASTPGFENLATSLQYILSF